MNMKKGELLTFVTSLYQNGMAGGAKNPTQAYLMAVQFKEQGLNFFTYKDSAYFVNNKLTLYGKGLLDLVRASGKVALLIGGFTDKDGREICSGNKNLDDEKAYFVVKAKRTDEPEDLAPEEFKMSYDEAMLRKAKAHSSSPWKKDSDFEVMWKWKVYNECIKFKFPDASRGFEAKEAAEAVETKDVSPKTVEDFIGESEGEDNE